MAGYQFIHVESYARTAPKSEKTGGHSIGSVMAEAMRADGACPHVETPTAPTLLFGVQPGEVEELATSWANSSTDAIGRKLRKDGLCLLAGVVSCPPTLTDEEWGAFKLDAVAWLAKDARLVSVIEHTDEKERHLHFYKIPQPGERFEVLHPGRAAALMAKASGLLKGEQNKAYKAAMRAYQDDFFQSVSSRHGMARIGPARRRLNRDQWKAEQGVYEAVATARKEASTEIEAAHHLSMAETAKAKAIIEAATANANTLIAEAHAIAQKTLEEADKMQAEADAKMEKAGALLATAEGRLAQSAAAKKRNDLAVAKIRADKAQLVTEIKQTEVAKTVGQYIGFAIGEATKAVGISLASIPRFLKNVYWKKQAEMTETKVARLTKELKGERVKLEAAEKALSRTKLERDAAHEKAVKAAAEAARNVLTLEQKLAALEGQKQGLERKGPTL